MSEALIVVSEQEQDGFVGLSNSSRGRLFEKHILSYGDLLYPGAPGGRVKIDDSFADRMIKNFNARYCPYVQVPLADEKNRHSEAPDRNIGQVVGLTKRDNKIYAQIDMRKHVDDVGETLLGASAFFDLNYTDTKTLKKVGPTLLHVAVTNRPYVTDLDEFQLVAASADSSGEVVFLTHESTKETAMPNLNLSEHITALRDEHDIDVPALQQSVADQENVLALSAQIVEALQENELIALSADAAAPTNEEVIGAIKGAADKIVELTNEIGDIKHKAEVSAAEADVDALVGKGLILPKNRDAMVQLSMSDADLFKSLIPDTPLVALSNEQGTGRTFTDDEVAQSEIDRLTKSDAAAAYVA